MVMCNSRKRSRFINRSNRDDTLDTPTTQTLMNWFKRKFPFQIKRDERKTSDTSRLAYVARRGFSSLKCACFNVITIFRCGKFRQKHSIIAHVKRGKQLQVNDQDRTLRRARRGKRIFESNPIFWSLFAESQTRSISRINLPRNVEFPAIVTTNAKQCMAFSLFAKQLTACFYAFSYCSTCTAIFNKILCSRNELLCEICAQNLITSVVICILNTIRLPATEAWAPQAKLMTFTSYFNTKSQAFDAFGRGNFLRWMEFSL